MTEETGLLIPLELYEESGVNIGTKQKSADMSRFIDTVNSDGLYLLNLNQTDTRIRIIASFLNQYDPSKIMVVSLDNTDNVLLVCLLKRLEQIQLLADSSQEASPIQLSVPTRNRMSCLSLTQHPINNRSEKPLTQAYQSLALSMQTTSCETLTLHCQQTTRVDTSCPHLLASPREVLKLERNNRRRLGRSKRFGRLEVNLLKLVSRN